MPTKATASENSVAATGNPYLDTLILGDKWNKDHAVTFYFNDRTLPEQEWIEEGKDAVRAALAAYENYIDLEFEEVDNAADANFVMGMYSAAEMGANVLGRFGSPTADDDQAIGKFRWDWGRWTPEHLQVGGFGYGSLVLHELGHGLGLEHPHASSGLAGAPFPGVENSADRGDNDQNWGIYTVMSYNDSGELWSPLPLDSDYGWGFQATPMAFDVAALQAIYGANTTYKSGNSTWTLPATNGDGTFWTAIWDPSGVDTMRHLGNTPATLDLREAPLTGPNAGGYLSRVDGVAGGFVIANGARIENAEGGGGADFIQGNNWANALDGNGGADEIHGMGGADAIDGGAGDDDLYGEVGADDLNGGNGDDYLDGGNGNDDLDGGNGIDWLRGGGHDDTLRGAAGNDTLLGEAGHDDLRGGSGNDTVWGEAGNDVLQGDAGNDTLQGDAGVDIANYSSAAGPVHVDLAIVGPQAVGGVDIGGVLADENGGAGGGEGVDTLVDIENLGGSNGFGDTLRGNGSSNRLYGVGGNDVLEGRGGSDILDGGMGSDTATYSSAPSGVSVNLSNALPQNTLGAGIDSFISIDNLTGSAHADILLGDLQNNVLQGLAGNDWLLGGAGNDSMNGGASDDLLSGGDGNDNLVGSSGNDVVSYLTAAAGVTVSLGLGGYQNTIGAGSDRFIGVENLHGSSFNDVLSGSQWDNTILGGNGSDTLKGYGGNDTLLGGNQNDTILGIDGVDIINGEGGNDTLDGGTGNDTMTGGLGNDTFTVDVAGDTVIEIAGGGTDTVRARASYELAAAADVEVLRTSSDAGVAAIDLTANGLDNVIVGNAGINILNGGAGADEMGGLGGNDTYYVDDADDTIVEAADNGGDTVRASLTYQLTDGASVEALTAVNGASTAPQTLIGNDFTQVIVGNAGLSVLRGHGGDDQLQGMAGNDTLTGHAGNDKFLFNTALNAATNVDTITDMTVAEDLIRLDDAHFAGVGAVGVLSADAFHIGAAAADAEDRIVFNSATGQLSFDSNGSVVGGMTLFAVLDAGLALTNAEFAIV